MADVHPKFPGFVQVSSVDVDAGLIWVGDPCYVLKDADEARPADLGKDWGDICKRFFDRSGYNARCEEFRRHSDAREMVLMEDPEFHKLVDAHAGKAPQSGELKAYRTAFYDKYDAEHPFTPSAADKGFANFTHDAGHGGMGTAINTFYGDGSYPVYIEYGEGGRPRRVLIDFDPGDEDGDD